MIYAWPKSCCVVAVHPTAIHYLVSHTRGFSTREKPDHNEAKMEVVVFKQIAMCCDKLDPFLLPPMSPPHQPRGALRSCGLTAKLRRMLR